jgi:hypothetical protein
MTVTNLPSSTSTDWPANAIPKRWVESLFEKMLFEYGKKFSDQWGGADAEGLKVHWANRLADMTGDELKRGVAALAGRDWPPTCPEFHKLCRPPVDSTVAYYHAVNGIQARERGEVGEWPHPAIYWASVKVGAYDLKTQSYSQIKVRWEHALADEMEKGEWPAVPEPLVALPAPGKSEMSRENAAKMVQQLQATDTIKKTEDKINHRAWIPKIFERQKRKDESLPGISVRFAKEAMRVQEA